jgi:uncharacterized membrane protein
VDPLLRVFDGLCAQAHCWAPGGETLPFCQRCTGFYVGAALALVLYAVFRPRPTLSVLWAHGLFLLLMVPFGYHLVPQNGTLRTLTGQLFAVGLVGYFCLLPLPSWRNQPAENNHFLWAYTAGILASLAAVQLMVHWGGRLSGEVLTWLGLAGLIALAVLAVANGILAPWTLWRIVRSHRISTTP